MRTVQFSVGDEEYGQLSTFAARIGLSGHYAVSTLARMLVLQGTSATANMKKEISFLRGVLVSFSNAEYDILEEYVRIKKGFAGPNPISTFVHKAAFDIMSKYPAKKKE
jgi:hypothetical protein